MILKLQIGQSIVYYHPCDLPTQRVWTQLPNRMSSGLALSLGLMARQDLKNEAAREISFSAIVPY